MEKGSFCSFGQYIIALRENAGLSQWQLSVLTEFNVTNLRKIEKGKTQPGVMLAVRLVAATGADVGEFFQYLAESEGLLQTLDGSPRSGSVLVQTPGGRKMPPGSDPASAKGIFGQLFKEARVRSQVTQKVVAEKAQYNLRNLLEVEKEEQEPGVMTALAMVCAVGVDIRSFFGDLYLFINSEKAQIIN